jgi:23S rRNA pseudouridine2605 synthase
VRLAKYLAHAGVASRRGAEKLISEGRVSVAGRLVTDPATDVGEDSRVSVDGDALRRLEPHVWFAVNKPAGVVSTARDTHGRATVVDLVGERKLRLYPVGRLDADSSGLILLTNDGALANRLTHPSFEVPKVYRARLAGEPIGVAALAKLRAGVRLREGRSAPVRVRKLGPREIELTMSEGKNRQVRRMCAAVGHPVTTLVRVQFGPLKLGRLKPGEHRRLSASELKSLREL